MIFKCDDSLPSACLLSFPQVNGQLLKCGGVGGVPTEAPDCRLKEENQYLLDVTAGGQFIACGGVGSPGTCGPCILDQSLFGRFNPATAGQCNLS